MERYLIFGLLAFSVMLQVYSLNLIFQQLEIQTIDRDKAVADILLSNQKSVLDNQESGKARGLAILDQLDDIKLMLNNTNSSP